jgi:hypothetical protein
LGSSNSKVQKVQHFIFDTHNESFCSQWGSVWGFVFMMDDCGVVVTSTDSPGGKWDPESHDVVNCCPKKCSLCFWKLHGRKMEEIILAKSPDGTRSCAWIFQTPSGVGCRLCALRYKKKARVPGNRMHVTTPLSYDLGTALPRHKGHLTGHAATRAHSLAVASFFGVEPIIRLGTNTLADSLPCGVPSPKDWWLALAASKKGCRQDVLM